MSLPREPLVLPALAEWAVAARPLPRESVSGDAHIVVPFANGLLAAAVDGLGHGPEAAVAAQLAIAVLQDHDDAGVLDLMRRCHEELRHTRGAVLSMAAFSALDQTMTWLGVGNVEGAVFRADLALGSRESLPLRGGVVGYQIPSLRASVVPVFPGDTLIFTTDGIAGGFDVRSPCDRPAQDVAEEILSCWGKPTDDALVLVVRFRGGPS